jgi:hypothetical protein
MNADENGYYFLSHRVHGEIICEFGVLSCEFGGRTILDTDFTDFWDLSTDERR